MALIVCPECEKQASDKADNCPNCGFPIKSELSMAAYSCPQEGAEYHKSITTVKCLECDSIYPVSRSKCPICSYGNHKYKHEEQVEVKIPAPVIEKPPIFYNHTEWGQINSAFVCPHCQIKGSVNTKLVKRKKGVSGAKATGALLTGGISLLVTGLSRKEDMTQAHCQNCNCTWEF